MIKSILLVALGGGVGSVCRYLISILNTTSYPWGTFAVNILGSLLIGLLVGCVNKGSLSPELKLLLVTGFCGGFTTFSTFSKESLSLLQSGQLSTFLFYVLLSLLLGIAAVALGWRIGHSVAPLF